jgi:hypothetical protein
MNRKQILISEGEKKNILKMYGLLKEQTEKKIPTNLQEAKELDADYFSYWKQYDKDAESNYDIFFGRVFELLNSEKKKHKNAKVAAQLTLNSWFGDQTKTSSANKMNNLIKQTENTINIIKLCLLPKNAGTQSVATMKEKMGDLNLALSSNEKLLSRLNSLKNANFFLSSFDAGLNNPSIIIERVNAALKSKVLTYTVEQHPDPKPDRFIVSDNYSVLSWEAIDTIVDTYLDPKQKNKSNKTWFTGINLGGWDVEDKNQIINSAFKKAEEEKKKVKKAIFIEAKPKGGSTNWVTSETVKTKDEVAPVESKPVTEAIAYPSFDRNDPNVQNFFDDDQFVVTQEKKDDLTKVLQGLVDYAKQRGRITNISYKVGSSTSTVPTSFTGGNNALTNARANALIAVMKQTIENNTELKGIPVKQDATEILVEDGPKYDRNKYSLDKRKADSALKAEYDKIYGPYRGSYGLFSITFIPKSPEIPGTPAEYDVVYESGGDWNLTISWWKFEMPEIDIDLPSGGGGGGGGNWTPFEYKAQHDCCFCGGH